MTGSLVMLAEGWYGVIEGGTGTYCISVRRNCHGGNACSSRGCGVNVGYRWWIIKSDGDDSSPDEKYNILS